MKIKDDWLKWGALIAALVGTASAEYALAIACGFDTWFAWCVPAAIDLYAVCAMRAKRDVAAVVISMIAVNAASHLVTTNLLEVSVPVVVAVSAIAPLVLWRVHRLQDAEESVTDDQELVEETVEETPEPVEKDGCEDLSVLDQLLMTGEPLPGRTRVQELYGLTEWEARKVLEQAKEKLEQREASTAT